MRLNRYLASCGVASRRKGEEIIQAGRVAINGETVTDPARGVDPDIDTITLDGALLRPAEVRKYYLVNKPTGVIVSLFDTRGRPTVMDILGPMGEGLFPIGRLDQDTSGAIIITDDGDLAHRLMHPSFGVEKTYRAEVDGVVEEDVVARFREGIMLDDGLTASASLTILKRKNLRTLVEVVLHQGRKRQVRRMMQAVGHRVKTLDRTSFGGVSARDIPVGGVRPLTPGELSRLRALVGLDKTEEKSAPKKKEPRELPRRFREER